MILVIPDRTTPGWSGNPEEDFILNPVHADPWETPFDTDAHMVQYLVPGEQEIPRLNKPAASWLEAQGAAPEVHWILVDIDNPGHTPWTPALLDQTSQILQDLPHLDEAGWYMTRHGYRLVWRLPAPIPYTHAEDWKAQFHDWLQAHGVPADDACLSWNHMFRAPSTPAFRPDPDQFDFSAFRAGRTLSWTPPTAPRQGQTSHAAPVPTQTTPTPDPRSLATPGAREYARYLKDTPYFEAARAALPLADKGARNITTVRAIGAILARIDNQAADPLLPFRLLAPSVSAQVAQGSSWGLDWLWRKCTWFAALEQGQREAQQAEIQATRALLQKAQQSAAETLGHPDEETVIKHLIIASPPSYYVLDDHTLTYRDAVQSPLVLRELRRHCQDICPTTVNEKGANLDDREILARYSTSAREIVMQYGLKANTYDPETQTLYERAGSLRDDIRPKYHEDIARWLRLVGGKHHDKFQDWLASLPDTDKPTAALYLQGENGIGKDLLANGIGRLWGAVCDFADITKAFNERLCRTPFVWANEKAEVESQRSASAAVRRLVGGTEFQIRRLYKAPATLIGCPRLLITANNANALVFQEALSGDDVGALVRRFGHLYAGEEPRAYLEDIGGREATESWVAGDGIAEHILWLQANRPLVPGARYLVEGWAPEFAEDLVTHQSLQGQVCIALVRYVLETGRDEGMPIREGALFVNGSALAGNWKRLLGQDAKTPTQNDLATALGSVSEGKGKVKTSKGQIRAWKINTNLLTRAAERLNLADEEDIMGTLTRTP